MLEASPEASKMRSLCFIDKARSVLDLRARVVVLAPISKGAYALHSLSSKGALERASEAFNLVASPLSLTLLFHFRLRFPTLWDELIFYPRSIIFPINSFYDDRHKGMISSTNLTALTIVNSFSLYQNRGLI